MDQDVRKLVESEWQARLGVTGSQLRATGAFAVSAELGANVAMSFLFDATCIVVVRPDALEAAKGAIAGLPAHEIFTAQWLRDMVGVDAQIDGPSWHSYVNKGSFTGAADSAVGRILGTDYRLHDFLRQCGKADVRESGFPLDVVNQDAFGDVAFWALLEHDTVTAAGNMSDWRGHQADVGVLTHPNHRGRGLAGRVVATMVDAALPEAGVIRYRALTSNRPSLAVARRLGFEPFGQNYRALRR